MSMSRIHFITVTIFFPCFCRFTLKGDVLYATLIENWPRSSNITLNCLNLSTSTKITLLGVGNVPFHRNGNLTTLLLPPYQLNLKFAWTMKIVNF